MDRKDWNRIAIAAAVVLVPGGFVLGAALAARRLTRKVDAPVAPDPDPAPAPAKPPSQT